MQPDSTPASARHVAYVHDRYAFDACATPRLAQAFRDKVVALRVGEVRRVVNRGIERGDFRPDTGVELAHELLFGPVYCRLFLSGAPLDRRLAQRIVDAVTTAVAA